jgi:hypothetical protein
MAWFDSEPGVEASLPAGRQGAGTVARKICLAERRSRPERSCGTLGRNKRPGEEANQDRRVK